jgi:hypothetical protein
MDFTSSVWIGDDSDCRDDRKTLWRGRLFLDSHRGAWHDGNWRRGNELLIGFGCTKSFLAPDTALRSLVGEDKKRDAD